MIEIIIFDMDGVLIDSEPAYFEVEKKIFKFLGLNISRVQHETFVGMAMPLIWEIIKRENELSYSKEELIKMHRDGIYNHFIKSKDLLPIKGVKELIINLKRAGKRVIVASSTNRELIEIILRKIDLISYFDNFSGGDEVQKAKPAPDIFLLAASKSGVNPDNCLVIEDSKNGVLSAKAAGMKVIGFINPGSGNQDLSLADLVIDSFEKVNIENLENI